jgi:hypothetical protein
MALCGAAIVAGCSGREDAASEPSAPATADEATDPTGSPQSPTPSPEAAPTGPTEPGDAVVETAAPADSQAGPTDSEQCVRAYNDDSPWNTPIAATTTYHPRSAEFVERIEAPLTSDPTQFTYPVYTVSGESSDETVSLDGWFSQPSPDGATFGNTEFATVEVPIPAGITPAAGEDAQVIIIDPSTGNEWGFFHFDPVGEGIYEARNGYQYNVGWDGVAPVHLQGSGFVARGAGIPYLAGLVRPCEVEQGRIEHAIAFSYDSPRNAFVEPASKSDGVATGHRDLPEGARLQLDPTIGEDEIRTWGCDGACLTVARSLQEYGLIVVDNAGRSKLYFEYEGTAKWDGAVNSNTVSPIPVDRLSVILFETPTIDQ